MKNFIILLCCLMLSTSAFPQVKIPDDIKVIMNKARSGQDLTEEEEAKMEKWGSSFEKQLDKAIEKPGDKNISIGASTLLCPKKINLAVAEGLTTAKYVQLTKSLMATYGAKSGDLQKLQSLLQTARKPTDGADMGALFMMEGANAASVYTTAWSASYAPEDVLTANNLGVALKDMGDYSTAITVLQYANKLKPNTGLILCNLGWVYREAGDNANAKMMFEKALKAAPEMTSPYLGLGLIFKCENNNLKAEEYLRKALADKYSAVGFAAMRQAKATKPPAQQKSEPPKPLSDEKGSTGGLDIPELPVFEEKSRMVLQNETLEKYVSAINTRAGQLFAEMKSTMEVIKKQQSHAIKDPDNSIVYNRDFSKEIMQFADITDLLFSENSNYAQALKRGTKLLEENGKALQKQLPAHMQNMEELQRLNTHLIKLLEQLTACGKNEICRKKVEAEIDQVKKEMEDISYRDCKMTKGDMEMSFSAGYKNYKLVSDALNEAIPDYYAFTNPVLERIYAPSLNEFYNLYREIVVINHLKIAAGFAAGLPGMAKQYNELKCVEPQPPQPPVETKDPALPKKDKKDCPLGENGVSGGVGALSFELSCTHVKLSGGEGVLWSVKRDFQKHETTIWGGVGVKGEYGNGNISGEATIGAEITIGQGDVIKDVAFTSSVKAGIGGLVEGEVSGRFAVEGGPSVGTNAGFTSLSLSDLTPK